MSHSRTLRLQWVRLTTACSAPQKGTPESWEPPEHTWDVNWKEAAAGVGKAPALLKYIDLIHRVS